MNVKLVFLVIGLVLLIIWIALATLEKETELLVKENNLSYNAGGFEEQPRGYGYITLPEPEKIPLDEND